MGWGGRVMEIRMNFLYIYIVFKVTLPIIDMILIRTNVLHPDWTQTPIYVRQGTAPCYLYFTAAYCSAKPIF